MSHYTKYPRTYHLPWSLGVTSDDKLMKSTEAFHGLPVVVTEKLDGENTSMYNDHMHARSIDGSGHPSRTWVQQFWASVAHNIPDNMRICGENVYARHSISYHNLKTYFYGFSVWQGDVCLSWDDTIEWFDLLGITPVPVLYAGTYNEHTIRQLEMNKPSHHNEHEGYVVRYAGSFLLSNFDSHVGKFVRENHVTTDQHWKHQQMVINELATNNMSNKQ